MKTQQNLRQYRCTILQPITIKLDQIVDCIESWIHLEHQDTSTQPTIIRWQWVLTQWLQHRREKFCSRAPCVHIGTGQVHPTPASIKISTNFHNFMRAEDNLNGAWGSSPISLTLGRYYSDQYRSYSHHGKNIRYYQPHWETGSKAVV